MPYRIEFSTVGLVPEETYIQYARTNIAAGYPEITFAAPHDVPLAIVGGGPSALRALDELKNWPGHIWGINQSASWLIEQGCTAPVWLFSVDPDPCLAEWVTNVERAHLGASCHPKLFEALKGKEVHLFHTREIPGVTNPIEAMVDDGTQAPEIKCNLMGPSSVCRVFLPAAMQGYKDVTFFGCEGSIEERTHAYRHENRPRQMVIRAGERDYITTPDFYITTTFLVNVMREFSLLKEKSGGLLRAMLEFPDTWEVVAFSEELKKKIDPTADEAYIPRVA
jgi:hypothetical protein